MATLVGDALLRIVIDKDAAVSGMSKGRKRRPAEKSEDQSRASDGRAGDSDLPEQGTPEEIAEQVEDVKLPEALEDEAEQKADQSILEEIGLNLALSTKGAVQSRLLGKVPIGRLGRSMINRSSAMAGAQRAFLAAATEAAPALGTAAAVAAPAVAAVGAAFAQPRVEGFLEGLLGRPPSAPGQPGLFAEGIVNSSPLLGAVRALGGDLSGVDQFVEDTLGNVRGTKDYLAALPTGAKAFASRAGASGVLEAISEQSIDLQQTLRSSSIFAKNEFIKERQEAAFERTLAGLQARGIGSQVRELGQQLFFGGNTAR